MTDTKNMDKDEETVDPSPDQTETKKESNGSTTTDMLREFMKMVPKGDSVLKMLVGVTSTAMKMASLTGVPAKVSNVIMASPEREKMIRDAGASLKDLREVAGLTRKELSEAINLPDQSFLKAVENGTATLSFELILRLSALLARHDPVPFILKYTRTYNPEIWAILEDWGLGRLPLQFERERQFVNIYRSRDAARKLSDEGFARVLDFTRSAFEMALGYAIEQEGISNGIPENKDKGLDADAPPDATSA